MARKKGVRVSFIMYYDWNETLDILNDQEYREMMKAIISYDQTREMPKFSSRILELAFVPIKKKLDEDYEAWKKRCEINSQKMRKRWERETQEDTTVYNSIPEDTTVYHSIQEYTTATDNDYDNDYDFNSVCNNNSKTKAIDSQGKKCHLGATAKSESCFYCMKKNICPLKESSNFLLNHEEGFDEWNRKKEELLEKWVALRRSKDQSTDIKLFDYNWLEDDS